MTTTTNQQLSNVLGNEQFKCKSCGETKNIIESVHVNEKFCVDCFNKKIVFEEVYKKIKFFKTMLKESNQYTSLRRIRLHHFQTLAEMLVPASIFDITEEQLHMKLDELKGREEVGLLKLRNDVSFINYRKSSSIDFDALFLAWSKYRARIMKVNEHKWKFGHFIRFIAEKSQFKTFKEMMSIAIGEYVDTYHEKEYETLQKTMLKEVEAIEDAMVYPNVAKYLYDNYERIYYRFFTEYLPFDKKNLTIDSPKSISRTDVALKIRYIFDNKEMTIIRRELNKLNSQSKLPSVCGWILINSVKAFNRTITYILTAYHKKLKIDTPVTYATNIADYSIKETQKFIDVTYRITSRDM